MTKNKKLLLIAVAVVVIGGGAFALVKKIVNDGVQEMPGQQAQQAGSDFTPADRQLYAGG